MGRRPGGGVPVRRAAAAAVPQRPGHDQVLPRAGGPGPPGRDPGHDPRRGDHRVRRRTPELLGPAAADARRRTLIAPGGRGPGDLPRLRRHVRRRAAADQRAVHAAAGRPRGPAPGWPARPRPPVVSRRWPGRARGQRPRQPGGRRGQAPRLPLPARAPLPRLAEDQEPAAARRGRGRHQSRPWSPDRADRLAAGRDPRWPGPGLRGPGGHRLHAAGTARAREAAGPAAAGQPALQRPGSRGPGPGRDLGGAPARRGGQLRRADPGRDSPRRLLRGPQGHRGRERTRPVNG